jgi:SAM-dependent methyltransferase
MSVGRASGANEPSFARVRILAPRSPPTLTSAIVSLRKLLLIPQLVWYGVRAPRDQAKAWDRFWAGIRRTGPGGEVLWDAASKEELDGVLARVTARMDAGLPVVDVGCGNGRFPRLLAARFPRVVGIDVSPHAIERAKEESRGLENVSYRVLDASAPGVGRALAGELGEVNVLMRGVFHVFDAGQRATTVENLAAMMGERGVIYCAETNYEGDPLDQLVAQGATPTTMPEPLRKCIEAGIKPPRHFGEAQLREFFPSDRWETLESGPLVMHGVPLTARGEVEPIPSFYAMARRRRAASA